MGDAPTWDMSETLCAVLGPDEEAGRFVRFRDSFVIRSADMKWRARFHILPTRFVEQPYGITFSNPMSEAVIELKHHAEAPIVLIGAGGQSSRSDPARAPAGIAGCHTEESRGRRGAPAGRGRIEVGVCDRYPKGQNGNLFLLSCRKLTAPSSLVSSGISLTS